MKIFAIAVLGLEFLCLLSFTLGEVDRYNLAIDEKGTTYSEEIDVDEKRDVEVFRVPAHNDVQAADFYHDFKMRVTATRMLSQKVCYISELDSSISSPGKLKTDLDRAALQAGKLPVKTQSSLVMRTGPANRLFLTKEILDFCGALPIYNTEHIKVDPSNGNGTAIIRRNSRQRRNRPPITDFKSCLHTQGKSTFTYVLGCKNTPHWDVKCKMQHKYMKCFHFVTCDNMSPARDEWDCTHVHESSQSPICCDFICPT